MTKPEWKVAESECAKIVRGYYKRAHRAGTPANGDVLYTGDIIASSPDSKILLAQVKDHQRFSVHGVREAAESASAFVNGDHVRYEMWLRGEGDWAVYYAPIKEVSPFKFVKVKSMTLPLNIVEARQKYKQYRDGNIQMEVPEQW